MSPVRRPSAALYGLHDGLAVVAARRAATALAAGDTGECGRLYAVAARHWKAAARIARAARNVAPHTATIGAARAERSSALALAL